MKKFKIDAKFVSDVIMGIIMIPFILVMLGIMIFALLLHFPYWKIKKEKKR
jgi:hypothetical protein